MEKGQKLKLIPVANNPQNKKPLNKAEAEFHNQQTINGWFCTKRGWPDFACFKEDKFKVVEVKPTNQRLKHMQSMMLQALAAYGIPSYRWDPINGEQLITSDDNGDRRYCMPILNTDKQAIVSTTVAPEIYNQLTIVARKTGRSVSSLLLESILQTIARNTEE